jgi:transposase
MTRLYGCAPRVQRAIGRSPHGYWQTTTFLAGLRHDRIVTPLVLDGPMDGVIFRAWVEQFLAPALAPGEIVLADNLASHKVAGLRAVIEAQRWESRQAKRHPPLPDRSYFYRTE